MAIDCDGNELLPGDLVMITEDCKNHSGNARMEKVNAFEFYTVADNQQNTNGIDIALVMRNGQTLNIAYKACRKVIPDEQQ